ncbi:MAG: helix-turn-helix transcriptional regulator [Lewinellaceae bacterium]|nr:helix-turn-helix transcriptional regulator [Phaeodactylibacter sp.]MCB9037765.1 helix-turn-helix transcriptional regulator [Lewinellaceae bacterium]
MGKEEFDIPRKLNRILEELEQQERSILWLSKKTGISYQTVYDYAHNIRQPNLVKLRMIAIVLGVKSSDLVVG